jgi:hypothetical protein
VRGFGLILMYHALNNALYALFRNLGIDVVAKNSVIVDWVAGAVYLAAGAAMLLRGDVIARIVYGDDKISS